MLRRHETLIQDDFARALNQGKWEKTCSPLAILKRIDIPRTPSPAEITSSSSGPDDDDLYDVVYQAPLVEFTVEARHYECWDHDPREMFLLRGRLQVVSPNLTSDSHRVLSFSHFELEIKTHGRPGRFSRESIWSPQYIDYAATDILHPSARHLGRTRAKSFISFGHTQEAFGFDALAIDYQIGLPQGLFTSMRTRQFRLTARAIFLGWDGGRLACTETVEANPLTVTVSHLRMADYS